ncbi:MAG TPA: menaquinone reductase multiheme cytochrome c subunit QrcA [Candidatus Acidoferrales bacterium]|nr:menaquinone reductase multiheme cytochrome c subunit QrcA [Candidatus Acidoferrales bacterium]
MKLRGTILFLAGALAALGAGWLGFPRVIYRTQAQPVDFSHKIHADKAGSKCEDCHALRADGSFAGTPTLDKCSGCHAAAMGDSAAEKQFIEKYVTPQREPAWLVYARQPENVYFSHAVHVKRANLKCERCHGDQGAAAAPRAHVEDRISGYSRDLLSMDACIACHSEQHKQNSCLDCHK